MKKPIVRVLLSLLVLGTTYFVFGAFRDAEASSSAEAMCAAIQPGFSDEQVRSVASARGGWYRSVPSGDTRVGATGWNYICRCTVTVSQGVVSHVSKAMCID